MTEEEYAKKIVGLVTDAVAEAVKAEREACIKLAEAAPGVGESNPDYDAGAGDAARGIATAIRERN